jgi:hypothetical protein
MAESQPQREFRTTPESGIRGVERDEAIAALTGAPVIDPDR